MDIVKEVFKKTISNKDKLIAYGFDSDLHYEKVFMDGFKAVIDIIDDEVVAKVIELDIDEEYTAINIKTQTGPFVSEVRYHYIDLLEDIKDHCFDEVIFLSAQASRIAARIKEEFDDEARFLFDEGKDKDNAVFKDGASGKWYAIIMEIGYEKIGIAKNDRLNVINVKLKDDMIDSLVLHDGYHRAYHMNKKHWLTIRLDDTIDDEVILALVDMSHSLIAHQTSSWIIPANPKFFDVLAYCDGNEVITWSRRNGMKVGDKVYIYITSPIKAIVYRYVINDIIQKKMYLKKERRYPLDVFTYDRIKKLKTTSVRSARRISKELEMELEDYR